MISGGRDKRVVMTELSCYPERYTVICEEKAPVLKMAMTPDQSSIWVATSESTINNWVMIYFIAYEIKSNDNINNFLKRITVYKSKGLARIRN